jgi:hypothetical protein
MGRTPELQPGHQHLPYPPRMSRPNSKFSHCFDVTALLCTISQLQPSKNISLVQMPDSRHFHDLELVVRCCACVGPIDAQRRIGHFIKREVPLYMQRKETCRKTPIFISLCLFSTTCAQVEKIHNQRTLFLTAVCCFSTTSAQLEKIESQRTLFPTAF